MNLSLRQYVLFGILAAALFRCPAYAETVQYSATLDNGGSNYAAGAAGSFQLPQFDPALGTLTSMAMEVTGNSLGGYIRTDNESGTDSGNTTVSLGMQITVAGPGSLSVLAFPRVTATRTLTSDTDVAPDFAGTDFVGIDMPDLTDTQSGSPSALQDYVGLESVTYSFASQGETGYNFQFPLDLVDFFGSDGIGIQTQASTFNFQATVTYTYDAATPIPEPACGTLVSLLLGMILLRRPVRTPGCRG